MTDGSVRSTAQRRGRRVGWRVLGVGCWVYGWNRGEDGMLMSRLIDVYRGGEYSVGGRTQARDCVG